MATIGGVDLSDLLGAVGRGVGDLLGGFRPETANPALAYQPPQSPDLWAGLDYGGQHPTAYTPPPSDPMLGYRPGGGADLWSGLTFGGATWGGLGQGPDLFGAFQAAKAKADVSREEAKRAAAARGAVTGAGATGAGLGSDRWADLINQEAAQYGNGELAEVAQALVELESKGNPDAEGVVVTSGPYAGQRAQGLGQIMPGNYPGVNLKDPRTNVQKMLEMLWSRYQKYGNWDSAVAAYFGAVDDQGRPTTQTDDNGTSGVEYVAIINANRQRIKAARAQRGAGSVAAPDLEQGIERGATLLGLGYTMEGIRVTGNPRDGVDCSSFTGWAMNLPRQLWNAQAQYDTTQRVGLDQLQRGDLVFFQGTYDTGRGEVVTHVGIYVGRDSQGNPIMLNAASGGVAYANLNDPYWRAHYYGAGRIVRGQGGGAARDY